MILGVKIRPEMKNFKNSKKLLYSVCLDITCISVIYRQRSDSRQQKVQDKLSKLREEFVKAQKNFELKQSEKEETERLLTSKISENNKLQDELEDQTARSQQLENRIKNDKALSETEQDAQLKWAQVKSDLEKRVEDLKNEIKIKDDDLKEKQNRYNFCYLTA